MKPKSRQEYFVNRLRTALLIATLPFGALAANWQQVQGNESPDSGRARFFGFVQPTYTHVDATPVHGLTGGAAAFNGQHPLSNRVGPDNQSNSEFQFNRAQLGVRGNLIPNRINYFLLAEAGRNAQTTEQDVALIDASISFHYIPGARIRAGLFKLPTNDEGLSAVPAAVNYVYYSNVGTSLLIERQVEARGAVNPTGASQAAFTSAGSGYRDWGVQVYDWFRRGPWELSYAVMASNGGPIDSPSDGDGNTDLTVRLQASHVFGKSKGPNREDASVWIWRQRGEREFGTRDFERVREGVGARYQKGPWRTTAEYLRGKGMIVAGPNPPFPGQPVLVGATEHASGWYVEGGWRFHPRWELDLRRDRFDRMTRTAALERRFTNTTLGLRHFFPGKTRLALNYEWRDLDVVHPEAIPAGAQRSNALAIADNFGDRISLELTFAF